MTCHSEGAPLHLQIQLTAFGPVVPPQRPADDEFGQQLLPSNTKVETLSNYSIRKSIKCSEDVLR